MTRIEIFPIAAHPYPLSAFLRTVGPAMWALRSIFRTSTYCSDPKIMLCSGPLLGCLLFRLLGPSPGCFFFFSGVFSTFDHKPPHKARLLLAGAAAVAAIVAIEIMLVCVNFPLRF